ncbi:predicted protein [Lichtheimia corymbifera JMRC:FSU:9682]|uniref:Uncharacterized protein n=1 Tax=Lichtheimia corymbifera JMRC:FSU:9682 TaxID=1263082 RepID=A0A068RYV4_9FUNG|nr:predicted protein [Lichtheimia corymbifera JMRC:FSU:9682]
MINLKHLSKVEFNARRGSIDNKGIQHFMEYYTDTMGDGSTLEEVVVVCMKDTDMSDVPWISWLFWLKRLKVLKLLADTISDIYVSSMDESGKGCPALEDLTLGKDGSVLANGLLKSLRRYPSLEYLTIGARSLSEDDLIALCTFRHLNYLQLQCTVPEDLLELLQDNISNVEIKSQ